MDIDNIINELKKLELTSYPEKEIRELLNQIGKICTMQIFFHKGKVVTRARPHENNNVRYRKKSDFAYKPQEFNKTFQRASTPYETMFYATTVPDNVQIGELDNMRIIGTVESIPALRDKHHHYTKKYRLENGL